MSRWEKCAWRCVLFVQSDEFQMLCPAWDTELISAIHTCLMQALLFSIVQFLSIKRFHCYRWGSSCGGSLQPSSEPSGHSFVPEKRPQEREVLGGWTQSFGGTLCVCVWLELARRFASFILSIASAVPDHPDWPECVSDHLPQRVSGQRPGSCANWLTFHHFISNGEHNINDVKISPWLYEHQQGRVQTFWIGVAPVGALSCAGVPTSHF